MVKKRNGNGAVKFGETLDGSGVAIFVGEGIPPAQMKKFLTNCKGVIPVVTVVTPLGLGVMQAEEDDLERLYCEAGEFMPGGQIEKLEAAVEISAYA